MKDHIGCINGHILNVVEPEAFWLFDKISIARGLSHICRFSGQVERFYSVAQHSVLVSERVPKGVERYGLLHDATEAFIGDVPGPIKHRLPDYRTIETTLMAAISRAHNLCWTEREHRAVHIADMGMLWSEIVHLRQDSPERWLHHAPPGWEEKHHPEEIEPLEPDAAMDLFIGRWEELDLG